MRLPLSKVYRAFPELDRFNDAQCQEYVRKVRKRFRRGRRRIDVIRAAGLLLLGAGSLVLTSFLITGNMSGLPFHEGLFARYPFLGASAMAVCTAVPALAFYFGVDHVWLRRRIAAHMRDIRCVECGYALLGLSVKDGVVTCPECGERVDLAMLGLTAADVMGVEVGAAGREPPG
jgi:hypothetical protein